MLDNDISIDSLISLVNDSLFDDITQLNLYNFEKETKYAMQQKKTILILFYNGETPISYKVMSKIKRFK